MSICRTVNTSLQSFARRIALGGCAGKLPCSGNLKGPARLKRTAFVNCSLFDGVNPGFQENMALLVEGDRISALGRAGQISVPEGFNILDMSGHTIIPGLIDGHVHICSPFTYEPNFPAIRQMTMQCALNNMRTIFSGVTTVCDMGGPPGIIAEFTDLTERSDIAGPRYLNCFTLISPSNGDKLGYPSQVKLLNPLTAWVLGGQVAARPRTIDELKRICYRAKDSGGTHLKTTYQRQPFSQMKYASPEEFPVFNDDWMRAIMTCGKETGMVVDIHCPYGGSAGKCVDLAIETGAKIRIQHMTFDVDLTDSMIIKMRDNGFYMIPTVTVYGDAFRLPEFAGWLDEPPRTHLMPEAIRQTRAVIQKGIDEEIESGKTVLECDYAYLRKQFEIVKRNTLKAHDAGIIGIGSDGGGTYTGFFGRISSEAAHYFEIGIPFPDILRCLTSINAEINGLPDRGIAAQGMLADLIAVKGTRPSDPTALSDISMVMKGGNLLKYAGVELTG